MKEAKILHEKSIQLNNHKRRIKLQKKKKTVGLGAIRVYKDGMFRIIFIEPEKALGLYRAITGKEYSKDTVVEIITLKNVFMSKLRNDLAFIIDGKLIVIVEHQSTINENMPLRMMQYIMLFYELYYMLGLSLYKKEIIKLPKPEFYVLYNGTEKYPPSGTMKLSDAFEGLEPHEQPNMELIVNVININLGVNEEILSRNKDLYGYSFFVSKVNELQREGKELIEAIEQAKNICLADGILTEFFKIHGKELLSMFSLMYDEKKAAQVAREEGREEGREESQQILFLLKKGLLPEEVAKTVNVPIKVINEWKDLLLTPY